MVFSTLKSSWMLLFCVLCVRNCWAGTHGEMELTNETTTEVPFCMNVSEPRTERAKRSNVEISTQTIEIPVFDKIFTECLKTNVEFGCYEILPNKSVLVPIYKMRQFRPTQYYIDPTTKELYICPEFFDEFNDETKFSNTLAIVTIVGTAISFLCIVLHVAMFLAFKKLRNLPGYCLFSLCIALLIAYLCTFTTPLTSGVSDCKANGIIKAFAFLGSFFWMNVMSYDIWRSLRMATCKLRLTGDRPMLTRFAMYSAYAWGVPFTIISVGLIVDSRSESHAKYRLEMNEGSCWFTYKQALLVYFAIPLFMLLFLNIVLFISSFCMINSATMKKAENKADLWSRFLVSFRLAVVMGLMWIFGVLAAATEAMWLWYLNVLCNVFQGVFIFFSFTFTEKTRKECKKAIAKKKSSTMPTQVSSQQSSSV